MKAFVALALLVAAVSAKPRFSCPSEEIVLNIPDDTNCAIFYKCDHGVEVKFNCETGLIYNPDYEVCDWPYNVKHPGCLGSGGDSSTSAPSSSTSAPTSASTAAPSSSTSAPTSASTAAPSSSTSAPTSASTASPTASTAAPTAAPSSSSSTSGTSPTSAPSSSSTPATGGSGTTAIKK